MSLSQPSLAFIEISGLTPSLVVADRCSKAAGVRILGIESSMGTEQCIRLAGSAADVREAADVAADVAQRMGARVQITVMPGPTDEVRHLANLPPAFIPLLGIDDCLVPKEDSMTDSQALGLLETQGLVAVLHATDAMLKASAVKLVGKEKIGAAYVTVMVRGDVAAVQAAIEAGKHAVTQLGGTLVMADVISRPHPELAALLPG